MRSSLLSDFLFVSIWFGRDETLKPHIAGFGLGLHGMQVLDHLWHTVK